jgi:putative ABC transport system permease protein
VGRADEATMTTAIQAIPLVNLAFAFVPVLAVALILWRWSLGTGTLAWATARMLVQLVLIGYVLTFIFDARHPAIVGVVLAVMLGTASWIAIRPLHQRRPRIYVHALLAIAAGSVTTLAIVLFAVLRPEPWFTARTLVPIAGMIFSSAMNSVSLTAERLDAELAAQHSFITARREALKVALIPLLNSFFAVGLVALPGMMTGQILSGVEPHIAVRYQIVVMCMTFGASGLAAAAYLTLAGREAGSGT